MKPGNVVWITLSLVKVV